MLLYILGYIYRAAFNDFLNNNNYKLLDIIKEIFYFLAWCFNSLLHQLLIWSTASKFILSSKFSRQSFLINVLCAIMSGFTNLKHKEINKLMISSIKKVNTSLEKAQVFSTKIWTYVVINICPVIELFRYLKLLYFRLILSCEFYIQKV